MSIDQPREYGPALCIDDARRRPDGLAFGNRFDAALANRDRAYGDNRPGPSEHAGIDHQ